MQKLPLYDEVQIAAHLHPHLSPAEAASPAVWALCHAVWIGRGCFGVDPAGAFCQAPAATTPDDTRVRSFLRRTGGACTSSAAMSRSSSTARSQWLTGAAESPTSPHRSQLRP